MDIIGLIFGELSLIGIVRLLFFISIGSCIGILLSIYLKGKNRIMYFREKDGRGQELPVEVEDHISCDTRSKPPLRIFKYGRSYEFIVGKLKRKITTHLVKEGTAYSWTLLGHSNPHDIDLEFDTLEDAVRAKWGKRFYKGVPENQKRKLRDNKLLVTVGLEKGSTPEGYEPISEVDINYKGEQDMANIFARGAKAAIQGTTVQNLAWMGFGAAIALGIALFFGFIPVAR